MADQPSTAAGGDLQITGIGTLFTGKRDNPRLENVDTVVVKDGKIAAIGEKSSESMPTLDLNGASLLPGLIDPHVHPVFGDFTPRHPAFGWIESYVNGGITTMISAGEPHLPGRPRDAAGVKALAILAHKSFQAVRPLGATVHAGAVLLEPGLTEGDFAEMAAEGVWLVGEIGVSSVYEIEQALPLVEMAKKHGFRVPVHVGGASVPGSNVIGADIVVGLQPHVAVHCNGGPTAPSNDDIARIIEESSAAVEVVQAGNIRALVDVIAMLRERDALDRLQIASDTPSGTGIVPSSILRTMAYTVALGGLDVDDAVCAATGQTARRFGLDCGVIEVGAPADFAVLDAPRGSMASDAAGALEIGDMPAVAAVVTDGIVRLTASRVTPPPQRAATHSP
ncbi:amidohydrolase family protein [Epidermidibacterium keratini]|uniref:amidohydrolase family protein n=1 Tax=Epidermidibacterium keratini TaxID=1891644 RepID=UPI0018659805|nr:amidohydrolase family protein [Epidermidibacterium keratini]